MIRLLQNRRSIRKYKEQAVEKEKINKILTAALLSPSSRGRCPWEFIVVDDRGDLEVLSKAKAHGSAFVADAPLAVIVIADKEKSDACIEDTSIALTCMQLQAERLDLGSCWVQIRMRQNAEGQSSEAYIREVMNIPDRYLVEAMMTFGYKGEEKQTRDIENLEADKVHYHSYGIQYPSNLR